MKASFTSLFLIGFGVLSLIMGFFFKNIRLWGSIQYDGMKDLLGKNYNKIMNIVLGLISVLIGLYLLIK